MWTFHANRAKINSACLHVPLDERAESMGGFLWATCKAVLVSKTHPLIRLLRLFAYLMHHNMPGLLDPVRTSQAGIGNNTGDGGKGGGGLHRRAHPRRSAASTSRPALLNPIPSTLGEQ